VQWEPSVIVWEPANALPTVTDATAVTMAVEARAELAMEPTQSVPMEPALVFLLVMAGFVDQMDVQDLAVVVYPIKPVLLMVAVLLPVAMEYAIPKLRIL